MSSETVVIGPSNPLTRSLFELPLRLGDQEFKSLFHAIVGSNEGSLDQAHARYVEKGRGLPPIHFELFFGPYAYQHPAEVKACFGNFRGKKFVLEGFFAVDVMQSFTGYF